MGTSFTKIYDSFLSKVTDDMYMEMTELDTFRLLEDFFELIFSAFDCNVEVEKMKAELSQVLRDAGYANAAEFFTERLDFWETRRLSSRMVRHLMMEN